MCRVIQVLKALDLKRKMAQDVKSRRELGSRSVRASLGKRTLNGNDDDDGAGDGDSGLSVYHAPCPITIRWTCRIVIGKLI